MGKNLSSRYRATRDTWRVGFLTTWLLVSWEREATTGLWDHSQVSAENTRRMSRGIPSIWR